MRKSVPGNETLPYDENIPFSRLTSGCVLFPDLGIQQVEELSAAYFNTFNRLFPVLDRRLFMNGILTRLSQQGYRDDDLESILVLLVCALGQLACGGVDQPSTSALRGEEGGFCGGTIRRPAGLGLFNQARRRLGMVFSRCSLESVQILLLQGTYFEACAQHSNFWNSINAASMSCMFLVKSEAIHWSSVYGDLVKRAFWICVFHERAVNIEFCVADTGIENLANLVPMPHFPEILCQEHESQCSGAESHHGSTRPEESDYAYHFSAMMALARLIRRASDVIHGYEPILHNITGLPLDDCVSRAEDELSAEFPTSKKHGGVPFEVVRALAQELDAWRNALPAKLQWSEEHKFVFTEVDSMSQCAHSSYFNLSKQAGPGEMGHNVDISVAHLRTCYYQARFLVHRPFIYKALHQPELLTATDRKFCAFAIEASCHWPMSLAPPKKKKQLLPHLFSWTQNFLAITLILDFCCGQGPLSGICRESGVSEEYIRETVKAMRTWLEDVGQIDGIAYWGIKVFP